MAQNFKKDSKKDPVFTAILSHSGLRGALQMIEGVITAPLAGCTKADPAGYPKLLFCDISCQWGSCKLLEILQ